MKLDRERTYINNRDLFTPAKIAKKIGVHRQRIHQWLKGGSLADKHRVKLQKVLKLYGFRPNRPSRSKKIK